MLEYPLLKQCYRGNNGLLYWFKEQKQQWWWHESKMHCLLFNGQCINKKISSLLEAKTLSMSLLLTASKMFINMASWYYTIWADDNWSCQEALHALLENSWSFRNQKSSLSSGTYYLCIYTLVFPHNYLTSEEITKSCIML